MILLHFNWGKKHIQHGHSSIMNCSQNDIQKCKAKQFTNLQKQKHGFLRLNNMNLTRVKKMSLFNPRYYLTSHWSLITTQPKRRLFIYWNWLLVFIRPWYDNALIQAKLEWTVCNHNNIDNWKQVFDSYHTMKRKI